MKMGNTVPRAGFEPTSDIPGQCATITPPRIPAITTIPTPTCLRLRGQCTLLQYFKFSG